jgi:hypothetical protein
VTVQYGEPMRFDVVQGPSREQQLEVATEVFARVRDMYRALEEKGRRGVIKSLREGIGAPGDPRIPAGSPR